MLSKANKTLKKDLSHTKLALRQQQHQSMTNQQLLDQLRQAVGRAQELEYLVNSKEAKIQKMSRDLA